MSRTATCDRCHRRAPLRRVILGTFLGQPHTYPVHLCRYHQAAHTRATRRLALGLQPTRLTGLHMYAAADLAEREGRPREHPAAVGRSDGVSQPRRREPSQQSK